MRFRRRAGQLERRRPRGFEFAFEQIRDHVGMHRVVEVPALGGIALQSEQPVGLMPGLHTFRGHAQAQIVAEIDDRLQDQQIAAADRAGIADAMDERPRQFHHVQRKLAQIGQIGIPGAEIVDGDADSGFGEGVQRLQRPADGVHEGAFGELQLQPVRRDSGVGDDLLHPFEPGRIGDLLRRDVHTHHRRLVAEAVAPAPAFPARLLQHHRAERDDVAAALGQVDEPGRTQNSQLRVVPAHQGLHRDRPVVAEIHDRLVVEEEFAAGQRARKIGE
ncbi:hypothetical protein A5780_19640 [Nocardia sp. 852002-20019_SCH5090214]|nr:hypothetical protein A5780_19640 [Nocardia sp. 852002-20019_SCH5090214]